MSYATRLAARQYNSALQPFLRKLAEVKAPGSPGGKKITHGEAEAINRARQQALKDGKHNLGSTYMYTDLPDRVRNAIDRLRERDFVSKADFSKLSKAAGAIKSNRETMDSF